MLIVNSKTRHRYTLRELLECEYPELLEAVERLHQRAAPRCSHHWQGCG